MEKSQTSFRLKNCDCGHGLLFRVHADGLDAFERSIYDGTTSSEAEAIKLSRAVEFAR